MVVRKESSSQYLAEKIRKAYVPDVKENYSIDMIPQESDSVNRNFCAGGLYGIKTKMESFFCKIATRRLLAKAPLHTCSPPLV